MTTVTLPTGTTVSLDTFFGLFKHGGSYEYYDLCGVGLATRETLAYTMNVNGKDRHVVYRCPVGFYQAGSMARFQGRETFLATWECWRENTSHGQHYHTLTEAFDAYRRKVEWATEAGKVDEACARLCPTCGEVGTETICPCWAVDDEGYKGEL